MTSVPQRPPKRVAMACTYCRRRKIKCEPQASPHYSCKNCSDRRQECIYLPVEFDDPNASQLQQSLSPSPSTPYFPTTASTHPSMQYSSHPQDNMWSPQSPQMQQTYTQQRGMPAYTTPSDGGRTHPSALPDATHGYNQGWNSQYGQGFALPDGGGNTAFSYPPQAADGVHNASSSGYNNPYSSSNTGSISAAPPMYCQCTPGYECVCYPGYACACPPRRV